MENSKSLASGTKKSLEINESFKIGDVLSNLSYHELHTLGLQLKRGQFLYIVDIKNSSTPKAIVMGDDD
jgi:hypothetical protein